MQRIGAFTAEGFARGIADGVPLATRAADRLATAATFDSVRADLANARGTGSTSPVTFCQTINATPDQSP